MLRWFRKLTSDEEGATIVEYSLLLAGIALVALAGIYIFGGDLQAWYEGFIEELPFLN